MREITFRGKQLDNGEWVQGYLFQIWEDVFILWGTTNGIPNQIQVDPKTVGQSTCLLDKNGKTIFEGDIVDSWADLDRQYLREVVYGSSCGLEFKPLTGFTLCKNNAKNFEIIGNIHDNPTLLKAEV